MDLSGNQDGESYRFDNDSSVQLQEKNQACLKQVIEVWSYFSSCKRQNASLNFECVLFTKIEKKHTHSVGNLK